MREFYNAVKCGGVFKMGLITVAREFIKSVDLSSNEILRALENEFDLDVWWNKKLKNKVFVYRPIRTKSLIRRVSLIVLAILWAPFSFFILMGWRRFLKVSAPSPLIGDLFFLCSKKSLSIFSEDRVKTRSVLVCGDYFPDGIKKPGEYECLDIFEAACYAVSVFKFFGKYWRSPWFYYSIFLIPDMIRTIRIVRAGSLNSITITNHYDRWAILLSWCAQEMSIDFNLVQHGIIDEKWIPPQKLKVVSELTCFSESQLFIFKKHVCKEVRSSIIKPPKLNVDREFNPRGVLVIGSGSEVDIKREISFILGVDENKLVYVKPHPVLNKYKYYEEIKRKNISILNNNTIIPYVPVVVHSGSTLAVEYECTHPETVFIDLRDDFIGNGDS